MSSIGRDLQLTLQAAYREAAGMTRHAALGHAQEFGVGNAGRVGQLVDERAQTRAEHERQAHALEV